MQPVSDQLQTGPLCLIYVALPGHTEGLLHLTLDPKGRHGSRFSQQDLLQRVVHILTYL